MAAVTLFTGAFTSRLASRRSAVPVAPGLLFGSAGLLLVTLAASELSRVGVLASGILLGAGYGWKMTVTFRPVATRSAPRWRATLVGVTYAATYAGFGAPYLHVALSRALGPAPALVAFAVAALVARGSRRPALPAPWRRGGDR